MPDPTVVCVMLTANRPAMARQAVECFRRQTYTPREMMIIDTGDDSEGMFGSSACEPGDFETPADPRGYLVWEGGPKLRTIGELRNYANMRALTMSTLAWPIDILCHWDDDDISHPNRIAEQVALLQASGTQAVGYNQMLFFDERMCEDRVEYEDPRIFATVAKAGEAWLYTGSTICGTSLCYPISSWQRKHFEPMNNGEDTRFLMGMKTAACSSIVDGMPRMIARIHSGNTSNAYNPQVMRAVEKQGGEWKRAANWDDHCRKVFA